MCVGRLGRGEMVLGIRSGSFKEGIFKAFNPLDKVSVYII